MGFLISVCFLIMIVLFVLCTGYLIFIDLHKDYKGMKHTRGQETKKLRVIK